MSNPTHGLCKDCLTETNWENIKNERGNSCFGCQKEPDVLFNQEPYCTACYLLTISSPSKSEMSSSKGHNRHRSFYRPIDKSEFLKKSFLSNSGKLIRKIQKMFDENKKDSNLASYLAKKSLLTGACTWDKLAAKVTKNSSIVYWFFSKTHILGAFHLEPVAIEGEASVEDQEAGLFLCERSAFNPQFSRVKSDVVFYSSKSKTIRFGSPSSFDISVEKDMRVSTELVPNFEWSHFYIYRP